LITIVGGGSWATALVKILSEGNHKIKWWMRDAVAVEHIKKHHHNPNYLSGVNIHPSKVKVYHQLKEALRGTEWVVFAIPAAYVANAMEHIPKDSLQNKKIVSAIKGMIPTSNQLVTDWLETNFLVEKTQMAAIGGPCHAEEVALEKQSYLTIASPNETLANDFATLLRCRYVSTSSITDLYGVEYAAVMKNIVALACGITHGIGAGDNFQAVMVANAMLEIKRFVNKIYPAERDLDASAYLGDLLVTAYSQFSRNRTFGNMIGRGYSVQAAQVEMKMVAEGYFAVKSIYELKQNLQISMPITDFAFNILYENQSITKEFELLKKELR
jgi:glycerol-3-phosphate dehydrogenase (NAD(P)+)